jgi:hypothetical protein
MAHNKQVLKIVPAPTLVQRNQHRVAVHFVPFFVAVFIFENTLGSALVEDEWLRPLSTTHWLNL